MAGDERPIYLRLREAIAAMILDGRFGDGDPLPSVRALAAEHGANPLTVSKAYQGLQDVGVVAVRRGVGMFVAPGARQRLLASERAAFLREEWPRVLVRMKAVGVSPVELLEGELSAG